MEDYTYTADEFKLATAFYSGVTYERLTDKEKETFVLYCQKRFGQKVLW